MILYIQELIGDKESVILAAMSHPGLAPKRKPTIEQAMKAVASQVEMKVMTSVQEQIEPAMQEMYDMYTLMNGDWENVERQNVDDYSSGLDDQLEALLEPYDSMLSADWLGRNTIDTRLWEEDAIPKLSKSVGKEVYKQLSYNKTPAKVLSNAGIVQNDVEIYLQQHLEGAAEERTEPMDNSELEVVAAKIKTHIGKDFDQMAVYEDLELACDDDEILAQGAGKRLGIDEDDLQTLQFGALEFGEDMPQHMIELVEKASDKKAKKKTTKKSKKDEEAEKGPGVDPRVLSLLKEHGGAKDTEMSAAMGVSRATYNNWINGKNVFAPDADQHGTLRDQLIINTNGLLEALALLDGTEQMAVS